MAKTFKAPAWLKRQIEEDAWTIPTLDVLFVLLMILVMLPHAKADAPTNPPPGNLAIEIQWPYADDIDVDLWMLAPGANSAVGYSNKGGLVFNLLRDDLGSSTADLDDANFEVGYSRGTPDGEYQVNIHLYRAHTPPPVSVKVTVRLNKNNAVMNLFRTRVTLLTPGQEETVFRWTMRNGRYVPGSMHNIPRIIRSRRRRE